MPKNKAIRYRPNVAAILQRDDGRILVAERLSPVNCWQFPQGGVDEGETYVQALVREVEEELSLREDHYEVVASRGPYRYRFENGRQKRGYHGQEQRYFLVRLTAPECYINVATEHQEFRSYRWIDPGEFRLEWLPGFKREVYREVLRDFFNLLR